MEQREIKFRAWHKDLGKMLHAYVISWATHAGKEYLSECRGYYPENNQVIFSFDDVELMQYTGLKDKNRVEIYEGDILKVFEEDGSETIASVKWGDHYPAFTLEPEIEDLEYNSLQHAALVQSCEIIGNIYEHPHLLNSEQNVQVSDTTEADSSTGDHNQNKNS